MMIHKLLKISLLSLLLFLISSIGVANTPAKTSAHSGSLMEAKTSVSNAFKTCKAVISFQALRVKAIGHREVKRLKSVWKKRRKMIRTKIRSSRHGFRNKNQFRNNKIQLKKS